MTNSMRIVLANEPRAYREVMAAAVQELRPQHQVIAVVPDALDDEVLRLKPALVLCSRLTQVVQGYPLAWIMLYPDGETRALISIAGQSSAVDDLDFNGLLAVIDETERLSGEA